MHLFNYKQLKRFNAFTTMLPNEQHPLTLAYIAGARSREYESMRQAMRLIQGLERDATEQLRAQCKLAAEVLMERSRE